MIKKLDKWCDNVWIIYLFVVATGTTIFLVANWNTLSLGAKGGAFVAITMAFHVLEEWKLPGGLHYLYNNIVFKPRKPLTFSVSADRYPMSRFTDMLTNVGMQFIPLVYMVIAMHSDASTGIALSMAMFSLMELVGHTIIGIITLRMFWHKGKRTFYGPGVWSSYVFFLPAAAYLIWQMPELSGYDWFVAIITLVVLLVLTVPVAELPFRKWVTKQEKGVFAFKSDKYYAKYSK